MIQQHWTDAEMLRALRLRDEGMTNRQIGAAIGRSQIAVERKLARIDADSRAAEGEA